MRAPPQGFAGAIFHNFDRKHAFAASYLADVRIPLLKSVQASPNGTTAHNDKYVRIMTQLWDVPVTRNSGATPRESRRPSNCRPGQTFGSIAKPYREVANGVSTCETEYSYDRSGHATSVAASVLSSRWQTIVCLPN